MEEVENNSNKESDSEHKKMEQPMQPGRIPLISKITLAVLVFINLLNYMDRYTIASVLTKIQDYFSINEKTAGLLNTIFVCSYMIFAPLFGYLGDRYARKYVMAVGVLIWSAMTFVGSIMEDDQFWYFFLIRGLVGIGEASYSTVAPTIIADLFIGDQRTKALSIFYFAIPCGSGLGYIVGSKVAAFMHDWKWALRVTPGFGILCVLLCVFVIHEPKRGLLEATPVITAEDEGVIGEDLSVSVMQESTDYWTDLKYLLQVKSFVWATIGFTCVSFVVGSLAFWAAKFVQYSQKVKGIDAKITDVSYIFGIITFIAGIVGVWTGAEAARRYRHTNRKADALVCGIGMIASVPFIYFGLILADERVIVTWVLIAIGEFFLCLNWAPNGDLLLYVIVPNRRATAEAMQILVLHLFGDAMSPFIVGWIADAVQGHDKSDAAVQRGLLYALLITPFFCVAGAIAYFICGQYLPADKDAVDATIKEAINAPERLNSFPQDSDEGNGQVDGDAVITTDRIDDDDTDSLLSVIDIDSRSKRDNSVIT